MKSITTIIAYIARRISRFFLEIPFSKGTNQKRLQQSCCWLYSCWLLKQCDYSSHGNWIWNWQPCSACTYMHDDINFFQVYSETDYPLVTEINTLLNNNFAFAVWMYSCMYMTELHECNNLPLTPKQTFLENAYFQFMKDQLASLVATQANKKRFTLPLCARQHSTKTAILFW